MSLSQRSSISDDNGPVVVMAFLAGDLRGSQRDRRGFKRGVGKMWRERREEDFPRVPQR